MEKYRIKTPLAAFSDKLLRIAVTCFIGVGWFVMLWGVSLPAFTAGLSLGIMLWLCARQFSKQITRKREKQMRCLIGGELALEQLLLKSPRKAAFECALWLAPKYPLVIDNALSWTVTGMMDEKKTAIRLIAQHPAQKITVQQIVDCARQMKEQQLEQMLLCLTAPPEAAAFSYAEGLDPPIRIIDRNELITLAGYAHPATDEDLRRIGRKKRTRRSAKEWLAVILDASRARRYFWYGIGMSLFALITGSGYYPFPAAVCLALWAACRLRCLSATWHRRWTD